MLERKCASNERQTLFQNAETAVNDSSNVFSKKGPIIHTLVTRTGIYSQAVRNDSVGVPDRDGQRAVCKFDKGRIKVEIIKVGFVKKLSRIRIQNVSNHEVKSSSLAMITWGLLQIFVLMLMTTMKYKWPTKIKRFTVTVDHNEDGTNEVPVG